MGGDLQRGLPGAGVDVGGGPPVVVHKVWDAVHGEPHLPALRQRFLIKQPGGKKTQLTVSAGELPAEATQEHPETHPPLRSGVLPLRRPRRVVHEVNPTVGVRPFLWKETWRREDQAQRGRSFNFSLGEASSHASFNTRGFALINIIVST